MNRAAQILLGQPGEDLRLEDWPMKLGFFLDDGRTHYPGDKMPLVRALQGDTVDAEEMILRQSTDTPGIWIAMSAKPLEDDNKEISGAIALFREITFRKQIELSREKLAQRNEALYKFSRAIGDAGNDLNQIMQVVAVHSADYIGDSSIVTTLNREDDRLTIAAFHHPSTGAQALLRKYLISVDYDVDQSIVGGVIRSGEPLLIPSIRAEQLEAITMPEFTDYAREVGVQSMLFVPVTGRSGVLGAIGLFRDRDGVPYTAEDQSFLTDISYRTALAIENCRLFESLREEIEERLSAKQALQVSEERLRSIFESTTLGIKVLDMEGSILQTNPAFQKMIGYSEAELLGNRIFTFIFPGDTGRAMRYFDDLSSNGPSDFRFQHRILHKDGSVIWVNTTFTGINPGNGDDRLAFIVGIVENITEQKRIELEIVDLKNRLQGNIEMERLRLAQELHDGPMQELYSAIYQLEGLRNQINPALEKDLTNVKLDLQRVLQELRNSAKELRPPTISNFGLEKAIRSHVEDLHEKNPEISFNLDLAQDRQFLPESIRLAMFRIFQQSIANVIRHAEATRVQVRFTFDAEGAYLEITDDGIGFVVPSTWVELARQGHYGLAGAAERVDLLGGTFTVASRIGEGTTIRVTIPCNECTN
jgi:PAS domain S-box-containing protein